MITEDLTLEQQFEFKRMIEASKSMSKQQAIDLLIQAKRLLMIKSNILAELTGLPKNDCI
jgi:hypothetical protein